MPATSQWVTDRRHNSLNFLRVVFALMVIAGHGIQIGGFGADNLFGKTTLGTIAVYGFFGISGYLIAQSASRHSIGRYLWQRFLRIFPAFWVALLMTAFVFGTLGWAHSHSDCSFSCYVSSPGGALSYVLHNSWLRINQSQIANAPGTVVLGNRYVWNGSLWTLFYEALCYLLLGALAVVGLLRRRIVVLVLTTSLWIIEATLVSVPRFNAQFGLLKNWDLLQIVTFFPLFLTGSLIFLYKDRIPDSGALALVSAGAFAMALFVPLGHTGPPPGFWLSSTNLAAPALAYPVLWLGAHLPFEHVGVRNDYSYGTYIYAYPVQQLLAVWGAQRLGYPAFLVLSVAGTAPFAVASWWLIERNALSLKRLDLAFGRRNVPVRVGATTEK